MAHCSRCSLGIVDCVPREAGMTRAKVEYSIVVVLGLLDIGHGIISAGRQLEFVGSGNRYSLEPITRQKKN